MPLNTIDSRSMRECRWRHCVRRSPGRRERRVHSGLGADLVTVYLIVEEIAKKCPSTAIGYKMRLEATELLFPLTSTIQNLTGEETLPCPIFACCSHLLSR